MNRRTFVTSTLAASLVSQLRAADQKLRVAVIGHTGRGNYVLPDQFDSATALPREGFEQGLAQMKQEILAGNAVLVLFDGGEATGEDAKLLSDGLYLAHKSAGDEIYTAFP